MKSLVLTAVLVIILYFAFNAIGTALRNEFGAEPGVSYCVDYTGYVYRCD